MADANDDVLRRSLDEVDRHRTRLYIGIGMLFAVMLGLIHAGYTADADSTKMFVHEVFFLLMTWITLVTALLVLQMTVMTKRILRAIELASRK